MYPYGAQENKTDSFVDAVNLKLTLERSDHLPKHKMNNEIKQEALKRHWHKVVQLLVVFEEHYVIVLKMVTELSAYNRDSLGV